MNSSTQSTVLSTQTRAFSSTPLAHNNQTKPVILSRRRRTSDGNWSCPRLQSDHLQFLRRCGLATLLLASIFLARPAHATGRAECHAFESQVMHQQVPYCVLLPPSYDAEKEMTRRYPELFASVSAHSAALVERLPAVSSAGFERNPLSRIFGGVFGSPPDRVFWEHNSPLTLAHSAHLAGLRIYFDCGSEDDYGFESGAAALHKILAARGIPHEFHLYPGSHSWSYFAEHLPASLEFHARYLGLR